MLLMMMMAMTMVMITRVAGGFHYTWVSNISVANGDSLMFDLRRVS